MSNHVKFSQDTRTGKTVFDRRNNWFHCSAAIEKCLVVVTFAAFLFFVFLCLPVPANSEISISAKKGTIDLSEWNIYDNGAVQLDGEWLFYWKQFIDPAPVKTPYGKPK